MAPCLHGRWRNADGCAQCDHEEAVALAEAIEDERVRNTLSSTVERQGRWIVVSVPDRPDLEFRLTEAEARGLAGVLEAAADNHG